MVCMSCTLGNFKWAVAILLVAATDSQRVTVNDCLCKTHWEMEGVGQCTQGCCNPDSDTMGSWCMVQSESCEDSDWGYCAEEGRATPAGPGGCSNFAGWHDVDGDECADYLENEWCEATGKPGRGWHEEWGNPLDFMANGFSAIRACCACGGGSKTQQHLQNILRSERYTFMGCKCQSLCVEDVTGSWCSVVDSSCQDASWGYCRQAGEAEQSMSTRHGHCTDTAGWMDVDDQGCQDYARDAFCTEVGGYGLGWNDEWGVFADYASDGRGANVHCCACGGGQKDATHQFVARSRDSDVKKVRTTMSGCICQERWTSHSHTCDNYCCNFNNDVNGAWCEVVDKECEGVQWGYCATSGLGMTVQPQQDASHCLNQPFWMDSDGDSCQTYQTSSWCTASGKPGPGWHPEWGNLTAMGAPKACCVCGGGFRRKEDEMGIVDSIQEAIEDERDYMWRVLSGPCKQDENGCITSGNYPQPYGPWEGCQIEVDVDDAVPIHVVEFDTELEFDVLKINGVTWSGTQGPNGIVPESNIWWGSDGIDQEKGWKLCPRGAGERKPWVKVIRVLGITSLVLMCTCCMIVLGCYINMRLTMPHGDGLGAGPTSYGKKYGEPAKEPSTP